MRISDFRVIPVAFPDPPLRNSTGVHEPFALRTLVRLQTDDGLVGWGETYGGSEPIARLEAARPHVLGASPFDVTRLREAVTEVRSAAALEVAFLDLAGKALGRPVADLLGGRVRERIEFSAYLFYHLAYADRPECMTPEAMLRQAVGLVDRYGFRSLKLKGGVLPPDQEIETIRLLRREFGRDFTLRLDPNAIWSVETSIRVGREIGPELEYLEDPTDGMEGMAEVRRGVEVPLSTNMCLVSFADFPRALDLGAVDIVLADHHYWGGLRATQEMARICRTWGLGVSMHSNSHLGISLAAMLNAAAATPNLTYACDTHYVWLDEDVLACGNPGGKWPFRSGSMAAPEGPGLGVEVDENTVARMERAYRECGLTGRDDVGEMRKRDPSWEPLKPRW